MATYLQARCMRFVKSPLEAANTGPISHIVVYHVPPRMMLTETLLLLALLSSS